MDPSRQRFMCWDAGLWDNNEPGYLTCSNMYARFPFNWKARSGRDEAPLQGLRGPSGPEGTLWDKVPPADDSLELPQIHAVWGGFTVELCP